MKPATVFSPVGSTMNEGIESVAKLIKENFKFVAKRSGVYTWWFRESCVADLLAPLKGVDMDKIQPKTIEDEEYRALYFGIATSCRQRAIWHMRPSPHHNDSSVRSGRLSTLRQTLSALLGKNMTKAEKAVNDFIGKNCYWQWEYTATREEAEDREQHELRTNYYPLNIQGNKTVSPDIIGTLKGLRKKYKN